MNDFHKSRHDDAFDRATQAYRSQSVPDGPPDEFVDQVLAALRHAREAANQPRTTNLKERILAMKLMTKITIAATVLIALGGLMAGLAPDRGSALAFSDVADALANVRTATWKSSTRVEAAEGMVTQEKSGTVMFRAPSCERSEISESLMTFADGSTKKRHSPQTTIVDYQIGGRIRIFPASKTAEVHKFESSDASSMLEMFRTLVANATDAQKLGQETIDGRKTEAFQFSNSRNEYNLWVDPNTSLPVLVEFIHTSPLHGSPEIDMKVHHVWSDFSYNLDLDESLFSLELPEGYTLVAPKDSPGPALTMESLLGASGRPTTTTTIRSKVKDIGDGKIEVTYMRPNGDGTFTTVTEVRDKPTAAELEEMKDKVKVTENADGSFSASFSNDIEQE